MRLNAAHVFGPGCCKVNPYLHADSTYGYLGLRALARTSNCIGRLLEVVLLCCQLEQTLVLTLCWLCSAFAPFPCPAAHSCDWLPAGLCAPDGLH
jgi:hypothetical protein